MTDGASGPVGSCRSLADESARGTGNIARGVNFSVREASWLSPLPECPIRVDARKIPENFLDGFRNRDCASTDCSACGYCERVAAQAVSIAPEYLTEVLNKYEEMDETMATGRLWKV